MRRLTALDRIPKIVKNQIQSLVLKPKELVVKVDLNLAQAPRGVNLMIHPRSTAKLKRNGQIAENEAGN